MGRPKKEYLPSFLEDDYTEISENTLALVNENLASLQALLREKWRALLDVSGPQLWRDALLAYRELVRAVYNADMGVVAVEVEEHIRKCDEIFRTGAMREPKEREIRALMREAGELAKVELSRLEKMGNFVNASQMAANQAMVLQIMMKYIPSQGDREAIAREIESTMAGLEKKTKGVWE